LKHEPSNNKFTRHNDTNDLLFLQGTMRVQTFPLLFVAAFEIHGLALGAPIQQAAGHDDILISDRVSSSQLAKSLIPRNFEQSSVVFQKHSGDSLSEDHIQLEEPNNRILSRREALSALTRHSVTKHYGNDVFVEAVKKIHRKHQEKKAQSR
jgi:hypothetical protein